jgi:hypothetical protein
MHLRDTTIEANNREEMANYYLYHAESPASTWGLAVEQVEADHFNVCVLFKEPAWDVFGVIRYWTVEDRAEAEARYLELQKIFETLDEGVTLKTLQRALPEEERHGPRKSDAE